MEAALRTPCAGELEGVQEIVGLLEVRPDGVDLVDEVLEADDLAARALAERVLQARRARARATRRAGHRTYTTANNEVLLLLRRAADQTGAPGSLFPGP